MRNETKQHRAGFSLIELMVVIAIIGILSGLAIPKFMRSTAESRLDGDANNLFLDIQWAKVAANRSGKRHYMSFNGTHWKIYRENSSNNSFEPGTTDCSDQTKDCLVKQDSLSVGIVFAYKTEFGTPPPVDNTPSTAFSASTGSNPNECTEGSAYPYAGSGNWGGSPAVITFCGGTISDMETGVLFLTTGRYLDKAFAIVYNDVTSGKASFAVRRYRTDGGTTWTLL